MRGNKLLFFFLVKSLIIYTAWNLLYFGYISSKTRIEEKMTSTIALVSSRIMNAWGFHTYTLDTFDNGHFSYSEVILDNEPLLLIANPCNGLVLLVLFIGFIIAYPGNWQVKIVYILFGCLLIYLINLIRIQMLLLNLIYAEGSFDFNHKYTYTIAVYLCVFMLWMLWANYYSNRKNLLTSE